MHTDDSGAFYERMLGTDCWWVARLARWRSFASGQVVNGFGATEASADARPTALYLSSNLPTAGAMSPDVNVDRGGWLRVHYGASGNVVAMTVRARCHDLSGATACYDDATETDVDDRATHLLAVCVCEDEQHYQYRWDELNRLHEARRYDRTGGSGTWGLEVRQRYRYDGANVRTVKETNDDFVVVSGEAVSGDERVALYVMAGDYERRGLVQDPFANTYEPIDGGVTEAQYLVSGARVVWKSASSSPISTGTFDSNLRVTMALPNLIQSTSAVVDLASGELLESVTFHPNGVRETLVSNREVEGFALEPVGFTGKEDDAEVGLVYFGERYLMPHLGRWASADPLQTHGGGGGEFGNSYHCYVAGNVLQARDPLRLLHKSFEENLVCTGGYLIVAGLPTASAWWGRYWRNEGGTVELSTARTDQFFDRATIEKDSPVSIESDIERTVQSSWSSTRPGSGPETESAASERDLSPRAQAWARMLRETRGDLERLRSGEISELSVSSSDVESAAGQTMFRGATADS